jgi:hypothetical protein
MKKYRYVGSWEQSNEYGFPTPVIGQVYNESDFISDNGVKDWVSKYPTEWEEVSLTDFGVKVRFVLNNIESMLLEKNKKYGNSALSPVRIFSKSDSLEQIRVRIDDKLSRISNNVSDDEDVINDLIGYLVIYKINKDGQTSI